MIEIVNMISNIAMAICAVIGLVAGILKFIVKRELKFKSFKVKNIPVCECIWAINKKRKELDNLSDKIINSLEKLSYDDADKYFLKDRDAEIFKKLSGCTGRLEIRGNTPRDKENSYINFYNSLTETGQEDLKKLEIKVLNDAKLII